MEVLSHLKINMLRQRKLEVIILLRKRWSFFEIFKDFKIKEKEWAKEAWNNLKVLLS